MIIPDILIYQYGIVQFADYFKIHVPGIFPVVIRKFYGLCRKHDRHKEQNKKDITKTVHAGKSLTLKLRFKTQWQ